MGRSIPSSDGVCFYGEYYCWLLLELEKVLLASRVQVPPAEHSGRPFDHIGKISKYSFKINGARCVGFIMKWPSSSWHQGIPLISR